MISPLHRRRHAADALTTWEVWNAQANKDSGVHIPWAFFQVVLLHVIRNQLAPACTGINAPLNLMVVGPIGVGKTFMVQECCQRIGLAINILQAAELESPNAGVPAERIHGLYVQAGNEQASTGKPQGLMIDDLDMGVGTHEQFRNGTTNTMHAIAAFMNLCDNPTYVRGQQCRRIPIFSTANDAGKIYAALTRPGRTTVFTWEPGQEERSAIGRRICSGVLSPKTTEQVLQATKQWSPAHYNEFACAVQNDALITVLGRMNPAQLIGSLAANPAQIAKAINTVEEPSWHVIQLTIASIDAHAQRVNTDHTK